MSERRGDVDADLDADVIVIGAGVVGCAIAREIAGCTSSGRPLRVTLVEARSDIGDATSKANTAILHTGFDATPGTMESAMVRRGYELLGAYAQQAGIPVEPIGAVLVAWDEEQLAALPSLLAKAEANGYPDAFLIDADEVNRRIPALGPGARGGLVVPGESIICPWTTPLAFATDALARGARVVLDTRVTGIDAGADTTTLTVDGPDGVGQLRARWVINAAGLGSDLLDAQAGHDRFHLHPRRGQLIVFDKQARDLVNVIVLPVPSKVGKGVLVSPTVFGNVMLGPTAEDFEDRTDTAITADGIAFLVDKGRAIMPALLEEEVTAMYAGLRAASDQPDFTVECDAGQRYVVVGGIRSTGLTASMALAEHVRGLIDAAEPLTERNDLPAPPQMPMIGEAFTRPYQRADLIAADPTYGEVVCFCERATLGEIRDALASPLPPRTLEGLRRRTRAHLGRCQGFSCGARLQQLLDEGASHG